MDCGFGYESLYNERQMGMGMGMMSISGRICF